MKPTVSGLHHIALKARGEEEFLRVVAFYRDVLGLPVVRTWGEGDTSGAMLAFNGGLMELSATAPDAPRESIIRHVAFATQDVDAFAERARQAGFEIPMEPRDIVIPSAPPLSARIAFVRGVLGEEIELFWEK